MANTLVEYMNIMPLLPPQDIAGTATATQYVSLKYAQDMNLYVYVGGITTASADQTAGPVITVEAATSAASSSSETALAFSYRISGVATANTWTAPTAATSTGVDLTVTGDNQILAINLDPSAVAAALADASHVRLVITPGTGGATCLVAAWASFVPRYKQVTYNSAT